MNKRILKVISMVLSAGLMLSLATPLNTVYAGDSEPDKAAEFENTITDKKNEITETLKNALSEKESVDKDETVYVIANADGSKAKVIVSDRLKNSDGADEIKDRSELQSVKNVSGKETFSQNGEDITWKAQGNEIVYRGETDKELPVDLHVTYTLDGKGIDPASLAGKSGHVIMTFEFNDKEKTPFAAVSVLLLNNNNFKNVTVSRGSVSSDGSKTTVCGLAFPGFGNALTGIEDPDRITVECDAENFKLLTSLTLVTDEIFRGIETDTASDRNELNAKLEKLEKDCNALTEGAATLAGAMNDLSDGTGKLKNAVGQLDAGAKQLTSNNAALVAGSEQIFESLLKTAYTSLISAGVNIPELTRSNYAAVLDGTVKTMNTQLKAIPTGSEMYVKVKTGIQTVSAVKAQLDSVNTFCKGVKDYTDGAVLLSSNLSTLADETTKLEEAVNQIRDGAVMLSDSVNGADLTGMTSAIREIAGSLETSSDKLHELLKAADEYNNFSGLAKGQTGNVRFIYRTASIGE
ncbi:MAG: hypothetical protein K6F63_10095 [Lachnospiraceae bacterium]|nr:hypothetical protein [Lachnospiraceae bacterium]